MKKFQWIYFAVLALGLLTCGGCSSTEVIDDEPETPSQSKIRVTISTNDYTRADVTNESTISSLYLAFYEGDTFKGIVKATGSDKAYTCDVPLGVKPDGVIAFANISEEQANAINGDNIFTTTITNLADASSNMVMSSSRYFDAEGNDMVKTPISAANLIENGDPVAINLDRVAAKVTVTNTNNTYYFDAKDAFGNDIKLELKDIKWKMTGTEKKSFLLKNLGNKNSMENELTGWDQWNDATAKKSHWAHSFTWKDNDSEGNYPDGIITKDSYDLDYVTIENPNSIGNLQYCHETTRPKDVYNVNNALASILLIGQVAKKDYTPSTFYINRTSDGVYYYPANGFNNILINKQRTLYYSNSKVTDSNAFEVKHPDWATDIPENYVTLQLSSKIISQNQLNMYSNSAGKLWDGANAANDINKLLAIDCGYYEMFQDGQCYFIVPIQHMAFKDEETAKTITGSYGLVRNHHYNITIKSISGLGNGVISTTSSGNPFIPLSYTYSGETEKQYKVNATVNINNWSEVNQEINIPK